ncbi:unnamed protein product, partial [Polarella glacialis]
ALKAYNGDVGVGVSLALAFLSQTNKPASTVIPVSFHQELEVSLDDDLYVVEVPPGGAAEMAGLEKGDQLTALNGEDVAGLPLATLRAQLASAGRASFRRAEAAENCVLACGRCKTLNSVATASRYFRCHSCRALAMPWACLMRRYPDPPSGCCAPRKVADIQSLQLLHDVSWEECGLESATMHPTGFGRAAEAPAGCQHHQQLGGSATCGIAAVNNLLTNANAPAITSERMVAISSKLGEAESAIREGAESVQEFGEEQCVADLYVTENGGHFDVQTLQIAFEEAGFNMWYVPDGALQKPGSLFTQANLIGYVCHRRDPMNPRQDHWFIVRRQNSEKGPSYLLQDSLYDIVFMLTELEAHQLCLSLPRGALFAVAQQSTPEVALGGASREERVRIDPCCKKFLTQLGFTSP